MRAGITWFGCGGEREKAKCSCKLRISVRCKSNGWSAHDQSCLINSDLSHGLCRSGGVLAQKCFSHIGHLPPRLRCVTVPAAMLPTMLALSRVSTSTTARRPTVRWWGVLRRATVLVVLVVVVVLRPAVVAVTALAL
jgi:hypothetical protein